MKLLRLLVVIAVLCKCSVQAGKWLFGGTITPKATLTDSQSSSPHHSKQRDSIGKQATAKKKVESRSNRLSGYHIITDIDDTVISSGGKKFGIKLGGVDDQFKRGQFYPGVVQFALELASARPKAANDMSLADSKVLGVEPARISVLTARAKELKFAMSLKPRGKLCVKYQNHGALKGNGEWGIGEVHYGSVAEWAMHWRRGWRKFKNFERMLLRDAKASKDTKYIFIGDTGDRDEDAAERMASTYPDSLRAVFLHNVYPTKTPAPKRPRKLLKFLNRNAAAAAANTTSLSSLSPVALTTAMIDPQVQLQRLQPQDRTVNGVPIYYFRTYIGAAAKALQAGLIEPDAVKRVAVQAVLDLQHQDLQEETARRYQQVKQHRRFRRLFRKRARAGKLGSVVGTDNPGSSNDGLSVLGLRGSRQPFLEYSVGTMDGEGTAPDKTTAAARTHSPSAGKWADLRRDALLCRFLNGCVP